MFKNRGKTEIIGMKLNAKDAELSKEINGIVAEIDRFFVQNIRKAGKKQRFFIWNSNSNWLVSLPNIVLIVIRIWIIIGKRTLDRGG